MNDGGRVPDRGDGCLRHSAGRRGAGRSDEAPTARLGRATDLFFEANDERRDPFDGFLSRHGASKMGWPTGKHSHNVNLPSFWAAPTLATSRELILDCAL